jgi:hypothetical protein
MKFFTVTFAAIATLLAATESVVAHPHALHSGRAVRRAGGHRFTLKNNCPAPVQPKVADTRCGFSPRKFFLGAFGRTHCMLNGYIGCADAAAFSGPQPGLLQPGASQDITIDNNVRYLKPCSLTGPDRTC